MHVYFISIDVVHAYRDVSMVKAALKEARCGSEKFHEIVYSDAVALAHSVLSSNCKLPTPSVKYTCG